MFLCLIFSIQLDTITLPEITVYPDYTVELLARVIHAEAGNQPYNGKLAVGNVVLNRMEYYEKPLEEVIFKPRQFTSVKSRQFKNPIDSVSYNAAVEILSGMKILPEDILYFANEKLSSNRKWIRYVKKYKVYTIKDHNFYYDPTARLFYQIINQYSSRS